MLFDRKKIKLQPLANRAHDLEVSCIMDLQSQSDSNLSTPIKDVANRIVQAQKFDASVILMMGAHVLRSGVQKYIIDLLKNGFISCLSMNGSGIIHDYEFARIGATTESVARYIKTGEFGMWEETGILNDIINTAYRTDPSQGIGEAIGKAIVEQNLKHMDISLLATCYQLKVPATVHVSIGQDIVHQHANCDAAATGALSYNDFLKFTAQIQNLENGVVMNFGSSVMAPEIFLKALSMARNVARQEEKTITRFSSLVCDLHDLPEDFHAEPEKSSSAYYFRPWKTMLVRTVADGGEGFYVKGRHSETIPALWSSIQSLGNTL